MKHCVVDYGLLRNPFSNKPEEFDPAEEAQLWKSLGVVKTPETVLQLPPDYEVSAGLHCYNHFMLRDLSLVHGPHRIVLVLSDPLSFCVESTMYGSHEIATLCRLFMVVLRFCPNNKANSSFDYISSFASARKLTTLEQTARVRDTATEPLSACSYVSLIRCTSPVSFSHCASVLPSLRTSESVLQRFGTCSALQTRG